MATPRKLINKLAFNELVELQKFCNKQKENFEPGLELVNGKEAFVIREFVYYGDEKIEVKKLVGKNYNEILELFNSYLYRLNHE